MRIIIVSILCLFAIACQSNKVNPNAKPGWVTNPPNGAVGSCATHLKGYHAQEELAITRARARLASRLGVSVSQIRTISEHATNTTSSVVADTNTLEVMKNNVVKATVKATWYDRPRDTVWAWLVPVK